MGKKGFFTKKKRWVAQALILSGVLNCLLMAIFFYFLIRKNPLPLPIDPPISWGSKEPEMLTDEILLRFKSLSEADLKNYLLDQRTVIYGYKVRDFALSVLASRQVIDVRRAVGKKEISSKWWTDAGGGRWQAFPGLKEDDFEKILLFLDKELFPQTSEGIFSLLKKDKNSIDPPLYLTFTRTPEFLAIEQLFVHAKVPKTTLCALLLDAEWDLIKNCYEKIEKEGLGKEARRELLIRSIDRGSTVAAYLMLLTDAAFANERLEDGRIEKMLSLLTTETKEAIAFATQVAHSPRKDAICKLALNLLEKWNQKEVSAKFSPRPGIGELRPVFRDPVSAAPAPNVHVIQAGESLWTISRKYQVPLEVLLEANHLPGTTVHPGKTLIIPRQ